MKIQVLVGFMVLLLIPSVVSFDSTAPWHSVFQIAESLVSTLGIDEDQNGYIDSAENMLSSTGIVVINASGSSYIKLNTSDGYKWGLGYGSGIFAGGLFIFDSVANQIPFKIYSSAGTDTLVLDEGGVAIGSSSIDSGLRMDVSGKVGATQYCNESGTSCISSDKFDEGCVIVDYAHGGIQSCPVGYLVTGILDVNGKIASPSNPPLDGKLVCCASE